MIFDKFCLFAERHYPKFKNIADNAKLFVFDNIPHEYLKKNAQKEYSEHAEIFALPFSITAIEDPASLVILIDSIEGQVGYDAPRSFIEVIPFLANANAFSDGNVGIDDMQKELMLELDIDVESAVNISLGKISNGKFTESGSYVEGGVDLVFLADKNKIHQFIEVSKLQPDVAKEISNNGVRNIITALEELLCVYIKTSFILEESPGQTKSNQKKILRSHQRSKFTILTPAEIRKKLKIENPVADTGERKSPIAHERRRHYRHLSTEGGHFKQNKKIVIPATWIGESEKKIGNKIYKVRLDV